MKSDKNQSISESENEDTARELEEWMPLSVREARRAQSELESLWPYVWMDFVSLILLFSALAIACYRVRAQSCH